MLAAKRIGHCIFLGVLLAMVIGLITPLDEFMSRSQIVIVGASLGAFTGAVVSLKTTLSSTAHSDLTGPSPKQPTRPAHRSSTRIETPTATADPAEPKPAEPQPPAKPQPAEPQPATQLKPAEPKPAAQAPPAQPQPEPRDQRDTEPQVGAESGFSEASESTDRYVQIQSEETESTLETDGDTTYLLEEQSLKFASDLQAEREGWDRELADVYRQNKTELERFERIHRKTLSDYDKQLQTTIHELKTEHRQKLRELQQQNLEAMNALRLDNAGVLETLTRRHLREIDDLKAAHETELTEQAKELGVTIAELRETVHKSNSDTGVLAEEIAVLQTRLETQQQRHSQELITPQTKIDELNRVIFDKQTDLEEAKRRIAELEQELDTQQIVAQRNFEQAAAKRGRQLKEIEDKLNRQRELAQERIAELTSMAEARARAQTLREADLLATITQLRSRDIDISPPEL